MDDIFTSLVRVKNNKNYNVVSVKSNKSIDRSMFLKFSIVLSRIYVSPPIKTGDIICKNILNTGVDIVATQSILKI